MPYLDRSGDNVVTRQTRILGDLSVPLPKEIHVPAMSSAGKSSPPYD